MDFSLTSLTKALGRFPLWPLLCGVLSGVIYADFCLFHGAWVIFSIVVSIAVIVRYRAVWLLAAGLGVGLLTHGLTRQKQVAVEDLLEHPSAAYDTKLKAVVIDTGNQQDGPYRIKVISSSNLPLNSRLLVSMPRVMDCVLKHGDVVQLDGKLVAIKPARNPHAFDRQEWLHRKGVSAMLVLQTEPSVMGVSLRHRPMRLLAYWRQVIRKNLTRGLADDSPEAGLIRAVFLGERSAEMRQVVVDFRQSGTLHVFAVSGLHVGMVGAIIAGLLWVFCMPRWMMITIVIAGMTLYAGVTGMRPPAVRAVLMASLFLSGFLAQRRPSLINSLAASAIVVILLDGHQLFTPGFQLSYGVLLAIALATGLWMRVLGFIARTDPFLPRCLLTSAQEFWLNKRQWLRGSLAVSAAAWMGSAPLIWVYFGIVTPVAIVAGIPLMLLVFLILAGALLSLGLGAVWAPSGEVINQMNAKLAGLAYASASAFAGLPGGHYYEQPEEGGKTRIVIFDLPYGGGAQFIGAGGGVLLDSGRGDAFDRRVMPTLSKLRVSPESIIVTHADSKHCGGMAVALRLFPVKQAIVPMLCSQSPCYRAFIKEAKESHCPLIIPSMGQKILIEPSIYWEILHAPSIITDGGRADDLGLVLMLHLHGWKILFTGDAGFETEARMLASDLDIQADVVIMGRNRHDHTGSLAFYQAVKPKAIVTTHAHFPDFERVSDSWLKCARSIGARVFNQEYTGAVTVWVDEYSLTLRPTLHGAEMLKLTK